MFAFIDESHQQILPRWVLTDMYRAVPKYQSMTIEQKNSKRTNRIVTGQTFMFTIGDVYSIDRSIFFGQTEINDMNEVLTIGTATADEKILGLDTKRTIDQRTQCHRSCPTLDR
jgi:hypothetical protein